MPASGAAHRDYLAPRLSITTEPAAAYVEVRPAAVAAVAWAVVASTLNRLRRGEGALLAINLSLIAYAGAGAAHGMMQAVVSTLAMLTMYAFNDLHDAPEDWNNPKKDRALIATWIEHRRVGAMVIFVLKLVTIALALTLGPFAAAAVAAVMIVNVVYSIVLKGVPIVDVAIVWLWGMLYAAIVSASTSLLVLVGVMTGICHLFQVLDDRGADAANGINTTAVRSPALSRDVLVVLSVLLCLALYGPLGVVGAITAFIPLAFFFVVPEPGRGWLLTKAYFAVMWLCLLGTAGATL